jgi:hypothetical protein
VKLIAIDPGDEHVGIAVFEDGEYASSAEIRPEDLVSLLINVRHDVIVIEEYRAYPSMAGARAFKKNKTSELIGAVKVLGDSHGSLIVEQEAALRKIAERSGAWKNLSEQGLIRSRHARAAVLHGLYFVQFGKQWKKA